MFSDISNEPELQEQPATKCIKGKNERISISHIKKNRSVTASSMKLLQKAIKQATARVPP
jgi:hypothetical protein